MTEQHDNLVERVREGWGRPALTNGERAEFDAALRTRLAGRARRRWPLAAASLATLAVVAVAVFATRDDVVDDGWFDTLVSAQAVAMGEGDDGDRVLLYGFEASEDENVPLFADPAWDTSADTVWDSNEALDLGREYEVLAFWLVPASNGEDAANTPGVP